MRCKRFGTGWQGLKAANHAAKASQRDMQFFCTVKPTELPNIMGLRGFTPPEPYVGEVDTPTAPGVERRGRMKAQL